MVVFCVIIIIVSIAAIALDLSSRHSDKYEASTRDMPPRQASGPMKSVLNGYAFDSPEEANAWYQGERRVHEAKRQSIYVPTEQVTYAPCRLDPNEKLFLWYLDGKNTNNVKIGHYWSFEYGLTDYQGTINKLFRSGLLAATSSAEAALSSFKVDQLKTLLSDHCLPTTGRKADLIGRIIDSFPPEFLQDYCKPHEVFAATQAGQAVIADIRHLIYYHRNKSIYGPSLTMQRVDNLHMASPSTPISTLLINYQVGKITQSR